MCSLNSEENGGTEWEFPQRHRKCKKNQTELKNNRNENDTRGTQQFRLENVEWIGHLENTAVEIIQQEKETETNQKGEGEKMHLESYNRMGKLRQAEKA